MFYSDDHYGDKSPSISVIIPVYNSEQYLSDCLDSVLTQSFSNYEVLVVDDGSTDKSFDIATSFHKKDARVKVLQVSHGGQGRARNIAMRHALGSYVTFLDSDDYLEGNALEKLLDVLLRYDADFSVCSYRYLKSDGSQPLHVPEPFFEQEYIEGDNVIKLLESKFYFPVAKLFKKTFLIDNKLEFAEGHLYEDKLFLLKVALHAQSIALTSEDLYIVRKHATSSTSSNYGTVKHANDYIAAVNECIDVLNSSDTSKTGAAKYYYVRYAVDRFMHYYYKRVPQSYHSTFARCFVHEMHLLGDYPILSPKAKVLLFCKKYGIFEREKTVLFRALIYYKKKIQPMLKRVLYGS